MSGFWSSYGRCGAYALFPAACGLGMQAFFYADRDIIAWWEKLEKPKCAITSPVVNLALDLGCPLCLGLGSYFVRQEAHGDPSKGGVMKAAFAAYGTSLVMSGASMMILSRTKNLKWASYSYVVVFAGSCVTTGIFYGISKKAGALAVPWTVWIGSSALLLYSLWKRNQRGYHSPDD